MTSFFVNATWDSEASVWVSESNIPGLVIEADTLAEFEALMHELAPELLAANTDLHNENVPVEFSARARRQMAVA